MTNFEVLSLASLPQLVHYTQTAQIALAGGRIFRMEDGRVPKDILYGELSAGGRSTGHAQLRYKDVCKRDAKATQHQRRVLGGVLATDRTGRRSTLNHNL